MAKTLKEYIAAVEPEKLRVICYAKDGNTVVVHHETGYKLFGNYYVYTKKPDEYGNIYYVFVVNYPACNYALVNLEMPSYCGDDIGILAPDCKCYEEARFIPWEDSLPRCGACYPDGEENFIRWLDVRMENVGFIRDSEIRLADEILKVVEIPGHANTAPYRAYKAHREELRKEKERKRREEYEAEERAREAALKAARDADVEKVRVALLEGGEDINANFEAMLELAKRMGVEIPIRVQGWIKSSLARVTIKDGVMIGYKYYKAKKGSGASKTVYKYVNNLLDVLHAGKN